MTGKCFGYEHTHRKVNGRKQKYCIKCHEWRVEREFDKDPSSRDGLDVRCNDCAKLHAQDLHRIATRKRKVTAYISFKGRHRTVNGVKQKLCTTCGEWKELTEYYKNSASRDGLMGRCRKCAYKYSPTSMRKLQEKRKKQRKET
jgi:hypothetical protein